VHVRALSSGHRYPVHWLHIGSERQKPELAWVAFRITVKMGAKPYRTVLRCLLQKQRMCPNIKSDIIGAYFRPQQYNLC